MDSIYLDLQRICDSAPELNLLCVGDIMLDRFVYGRVNRISPEAPIPVLFQTSQTCMPGAVGNVARNSMSLGASTSLVSAVGMDSAADEIADLLKSETRLTAAVARASDRNTTVKVRYVSAGQQLLRVDSEQTAKLPPETEADLISSIVRLAQDSGAILLSDYAKGVVTDAVIQACLLASEKNDIPLIVDPKGLDFHKYGAATLIKPNVSELSAAISMPLNTDEEVEAGLEKALSTFGAEAILLTRSEKGLSFLHRGGKVQHYAAEKREVFDVSGAGDTSLAALGIALASGASIEAAAQFALIASGIAVGKAMSVRIDTEQLRREGTPNREDSDSLRYLLSPGF